MQKDIISLAEFAHGFYYADAEMKSSDNDCICIRCIIR